MHIIKLAMKETRYTIFTLYFKVNSICLFYQMHQMINNLQNTLSMLKINQMYIQWISYSFKTPMLRFFALNRYENKKYIIEREQGN